MPETLNKGFISGDNNLFNISIIFVWDRSSVATKNGNREGKTFSKNREIEFTTAFILLWEYIIKNIINIIKKIFIISLLFNLDLYTNNIFIVKNILCD